MLLSAGYGKETIEFEIPEGKEIDIVSYCANSDGDDQQNIIKALQHPVGSVPLWQLAQGKKQAVILISDSSRLVPSHVFLPFIVEELIKGGMKEEQIKIVVSLGIHRKQTKEELRQLVGDPIYRSIQVINHSPLPEDCTYVGNTQLGTPIEILTKVVEADLRIATGNMEPHGLAGLSGGVKALVPGVASTRCIEHNHGLSLHWKAQPGDPENPLRRDMEEALKYVDIHFLFNTVVNHRREIVEAVAGHIKLAHRHLADQVKQRFIVPVHKTYDFVIASTGGYPKDTQLYQAVKTLQNAAKITKPGGKILLIAECREMFGNGMFQYWVETVQDHKRIEQMMKQQFVLGAHKIGHIGKVLEQHQVYLYSEMPRASVELVGFESVENLRACVETLAQLGTMAFMPYGALTFPNIKPHST